MADDTTPAVDRSERRSVRRRSHLLLLFALVSVVLGAAFLVASYQIRSSYPWLSDLFLNFGAIVLGVLITVFVVERFVTHLEEQRWKPVLAVTAHYVGRIANRTTTAYQGALGIGEDALPRDKIGPRNTDHERIIGLSQFIKETLLPAVGNLENLDEAGWKALMEELMTAKGEGQEALLLMGNRLPPDVFESILLHRRATDSVESTYDFFSPILGVPDGVPVVIVRGTLPARMFDPASKAERADYKRVALKTAQADARKVLLEAERLLSTTLSLYPKDAWWRRWHPRIRGAKNGATEAAPRPRDKTR